MLPREELLKIALAHVEAGAKFVYDGRGVPVLYHEGQKCMIGLFIPASTYFCREDIEQMTTYQMRDAGIFGEDEHDFIKEMDRVNILENEEWLNAIKEKINELEACN
ncbi:MAG: hypothetical protein ACYTBS_11690 [Planctomycetota bacterium]|jgi:hypothetical protein